MRNIDKDAMSLGIKPEIWSDFKKMYVQDDLPGFLEADAKARESTISYDAWLDHKKRMAMRWFGYYRKAKTVEKACEIGKQYNCIGMMIERGQQR